MYDPSEKRIEKLFNSLIKTLNEETDKDDAISNTEIISALGEVILTVNSVNLQGEREIRSALN